jgi:nitrite reductase/ring-hydroxylating ferredoxin subunit
MKAGTFEVFNLIVDNTSKGSLGRRRPAIRVWRDKVNFVSIEGGARWQSKPSGSHRAGRQASGFNGLLTGLCWSGGFSDWWRGWDGAAMVLEISSSGGRWHRRAIWTVQPLRCSRFGRELALWRDANGEPVVMKDQCPHRGAACLARSGDGALSKAYHGWSDASGRCVSIPAQPAFSHLVDTAPAVEGKPRPGNSSRSHLDLPFKCRL